MDFCKLEGERYLKKKIGGFVLSFPGYGRYNLHCLNSNTVFFIRECLFFTLNTYHNTIIILHLLFKYCKKKILSGKDSTIHILLLIYI